MNSYWPSEALTSDETAALLSTLGEDEGHPEGLESTGHQVDLASPDAPLRDALARIDARATEAARSLQRVWLRALGCRISIEARPAELGPFSALVPASTGGLLGVLHAGDTNPAVIGFSPALSAALLERRLGIAAGVRASQSPLSAVEPTPLERRIVRPIVESLVEAISFIWWGQARALTLEGFATRISTLESPGLLETVLCAPFRVSIDGGEPETFAILLPSAAISTLPSDEPVEVVRARGQSYGTRRRLERHLQGTQVEAVVGLGATKMTLRSLMSLKVGDELRLDSAPEGGVEVEVGGAVVAKGKVVTHLGNHAVELSTTRFRRD